MSKCGNEEPVLNRNRFAALAVEDKDNEYKEKKVS